MALQYYLLVHFPARYDLTVVEEALRPHFNKPPMTWPITHPGMTTACFAIETPLAPDFYIQDLRPILDASLGPIGIQRVNVTMSKIIGQGHFGTVGLE